MELIFFVAIIVFSVFIILTIIYYIKEKKREALIALIVGIFSTFFSIVIPLYSDEIKSILPPFDKSTETTTTTETTTEEIPETTYETTTTELNNTTTTSPVEHSIFKFDKNNLIFSGQFTSENKNNIRHINLSIDKTGYYSFNFSNISNINNTYYVKILDNTGRELIDISSERKSFEVYLKKNNNYDFYVYVNNLKTDFSFEMKMYLPNN